MAMLKYYVKLPGDNDLDGERYDLGTSGPVFISWKLLKNDQPKV